MKKLLAFDLDGTLVDSRHDIAASANAALEAVGLPRRPADEIVRFVGGGARNLVARSVEPHIEKLEAALEAWHRHYSAHLLDTTRPYPGIAALLDELAPRFLLAVATNKPGRYARTICEALFPGRFVQVIGGDEGPRKPDPALLDRIAAAQGMPIAAYVGDMPIDRQTAAAYGCRFVGVTWGFGSFDAACPVAGDAAALRDLLAEGYMGRP
ncbi:HAD family hydrolase [Vulgatibacter sp.]|uniref:HAD family hydrolase n=1 Tax=Vulgatibacter sp. TaxID=1971226 RepID=UPI0035650F73